MPEKIKIALAQGATCSGCDIAVLDLDVELVKLFEIAELSFAPLVSDVKLADVEAMADGEITLCLYHGAVRNSENEHIARLLRRKSKVLVAYGACSAFGGIPGLANTTTRARILDTVYDETATTVNPDHTRPQTTYVSPEGHELRLPELFEDVKALDDVVDVDYLVGACPPTREMNLKLLQVVADFVQGKAPLPPKGLILACERTLCEECPRKRPDKVVIVDIKSIDYTRLDPEKCFLEQGLLCFGPATRGGCDAKCMKVNMPCRGCMGPTGAVLDHGGSMLSAFASVLKVSGTETEIPEEEIEALMTRMRDPLGTLYRFTLPKSLLRRVRKDRGGAAKPATDKDAST
ncbi:MAG: NAD-reducing hydrogenase HoxS subunit delta [Lentisphaerae bacterium ADurb.BinA184]|nr:MAG: NAD-reducing hydrogenase HoxS subunit delta [Lentisphaerae bacterium ADurb.BinA184]